MSRLSIYFQNVRGLRTKSADLYLSGSTCEYDCVCLVETWLSSDVINSEYFTNNFCVFRKDRNHEVSNKTRGGGALIAVSSKYVALGLDLSAFSILAIDIVGCKIKFGHEFTYLFSVYIAPDISLHDFESFFQFLESFVLDKKNILLLGDFNVPNFINSTKKKSQNRR